MAQKNYKISLCGDPGVGKTSIALRQAQNSFPPVHQPTLGANFLIWNTIIEGEEIKLIIADSGSQERFLPVLPTYFQGSLAAAIVFDITSQESFDKLDFWLETLKKGVGEIPIVLVGNKNDLKSDREVSIEDAEKYAEQLNTLYFEVSAKDNVNLFPLFKKMAEIAIEQDNR
ncbi:MAG: GTP-binding protein [Candidatus Heimdallarchaeota archaeon]|nr:GTP-binding protein [Candidatus Heimdallarchaeota archaeon]MCK4769588.1 GTP-binding protein [Candidatus Heimdallarchaeota archaeon]